MKKATTTGRTRLRWQFQHSAPKPADKAVKSDIETDDSKDNKNPDKLIKP